MAETATSSSEQVIVQVGATEEDEEGKFKTEHSSADEEAIADENNNNDTVKTEISFKSLLYGAHSYYAVVKPVILTMILTALSITYVTTEKSLKDGQQSMEIYTPAFDVSNDDGSSGDGELLAKSALNALIICGAIGSFTFVIVLLYKYRCMRALLGFMVFSSALLFGVLGYQLWHNAMERYKFMVDHFTFYLVLYNISVVGTLSIYFSKSYGIPLIITQGFLILSATLVAWQFAHFDAWTAWLLLVMLSLYDLCAVLTPCGPLKALVNLMQSDDAPELPGLLYEAELPSNVGRRNRQSSTTAQNNDTSADTSETQSNNNNAIQTTDTNDNQEDDQSISSKQQLEMSTVANTNHPNDSNGESAGSKQNAEETIDVVPSLHISSDPNYHDHVAENTNEPISPINSYIPESLLPNNATNSMNHPPPVPIPTTVTGTVPLALAQIYRLKILEPPIFANIEPFSQSANNNSNPNETKQSVNDLLASKFTPDELKTDVIVEYPSKGGVIEQDMDHPLNQQSPRYVIKDRHGGIKRVLLLDTNGRVMEEVQNDSLTPQQRTNSTRRAQSSSRTNESIKLGLGDFIFYSLLVSKAAMYSFTTFATCVVVIINGLGGTLILLSVFNKALPALPISILFGVLCYLLTRYTIEPMMKDIIFTPLYV